MIAQSKADKNRVCLCLAAKTLPENLAVLEAQTCFDPLMDFAELRLDCMLDFSSPEVLSASLERFCRDLVDLPAGVRFVLTLRKAIDGGLCPDSLGDDEYTKILARCVGAFPDNRLAYVDLDVAFLERAFCVEREVPKAAKNPGILPDCVRLLDELRHIGAGLLVSVHHFGALPENGALNLALKNLFDKLKDLANRLPKPFTDFLYGAASGDPSETTKLVFKLALTVSSSAELLRFYRFAQTLVQQEAAENNKEQNPKKTRPYSFVLLAMGELGSSTRVLRPHTGSLWSFCYPAQNFGSAAPMQNWQNLQNWQNPQKLGQISLSELIELYNYRNISAQTRIYGVIGNPVRHSRSPEIHNPIYRKNGWNAVYLRFCVDSLIDFLALSEWLPIFGISVTVPHKERAAQLAGSVGSGSGILGQPVVAPVVATERVKLLGAANTLYRNDIAGRWFAENTDVEGFLWPLREFLLAFCPEQSLSGRKAAIIGAGGSARAVAYALLQEGMDCEVYNRTAQRADQLQKQFSASRALPGRIIKAGALRGGESISAGCLLIVQCTSLGMYEAKSPIPDYRFHAGQIAYDLIYQPAMSAFLQQAKREGAFVLNGAAMLKAQAEAQIRLFGRANNFEN